MGITSYEFNLTVTSAIQGSLNSSSTSSKSILFQSGCDVWNIEVRCSHETCRSTPQSSHAENDFHAEGDLKGVSERVDLIDG